MKRILILLFFCTFLICNNVKAESVYFNRWIPNIYIKKINNNNIYYIQGNIVSRTSNNQHVYCIEPFKEISYSDVYTNITKNMDSVLNINNYKLKRISLIAYFGYGYGNHTDLKWYQITQIMIWREIDPYSKFFFTDTLNGNYINTYDKDIQEINNMVNTYLKKISFSNSEYNMTINDELVLKDANGVLNDYKILTNSEYQKDGQNLIINSTDIEEKRIIKFVKEFKYYKNKISILYNSSNQTLFVPGNLDYVEENININVVSGSINITRVNMESKDYISKGESTLIGSKYGLYDTYNNLIKILEIDDDFKDGISNLKIGKYKLKEIQNSLGYYLDTNVYEIDISYDNKDIDLVLEASPIKYRIDIIKYYDNNLKEKNIEFEIYDINNLLIDTIITNENGECFIELYYGTYTFKQKNTTKNYIKVDDFVALTQKNERIELYDTKYLGNIEIINKDIDTDKIIKEESNIIINDNDYVIQDGYKFIENIEAKEYIVKQKSPPKGYLIDKNKYYVIIDDSNDSITQQLIIYNRKVPSLSVKVPDTKQDYVNEYFLFLKTYIIKKYNTNI